MNSIKKILILSLIILLVVGCNKKVEEKTNIKENNNMEEITMKIIINNNEYQVDLEENDTIKELVKLLPQEYKMNELNGNEKYVYLDKSLPTNSYDPKHINKGDIMLFGDNCLVLFYKSFDTSYSYTKIGHINNLEDLSKDNIKVRFE